MVRGKGIVLHFIKIPGTLCFSLCYLIFHPACNTTPFVVPCGRIGLVQMYLVIGVMRRCACAAFRQPPVPNPQCR
jgi:hypothetical protein